MNIFLNIEKNDEKTSGISLKILKPPPQHFRNFSIGSKLGTKIYF